MNWLISSISRTTSLLKKIEIYILLFNIFLFSINWNTKFSHRNCAFSILGEWTLNEITMNSFIHYVMSFLHTQIYPFTLWLWIRNGLNTKYNIPRHQINEKLCVYFRTNKITNWKFKPKKKEKWNCITKNYGVWYLFLYISFRSFSFILFLLTYLVYVYIYTFFFYQDRFYIHGCYKYNFLFVSIQHWDKERKLKCFIFIFYVFKLSC